MLQFEVEYWKENLLNILLYFLSLFIILVLPLTCFSYVPVFYYSIVNTIHCFDLRVKYKKSLSCYCYFKANGGADIESIICHHNLELTHNLILHCEVVSTMFSLSSGRGYGCKGGP